MGITVILKPGLYFKYYIYNANVDFIVYEGLWMYIPRITRMISMSLEGHVEDWL